MARWVISENDANIDLMSKTLNIDPVFSYVLANRGLRTKKTAVNYLNPSLENLYDTFLMKDLIKAIELLLKSISLGEKIVIYGDYDADGVMSTVILYKTLKILGADVSYYIPHREEEGYGLNRETAIKLCEAGFDLVLTCDNGISAIEEIKLLKEKGVKVIIIDHHEPSFVEAANGNRVDLTPEACAVIDPKQHLCEYPFDALCAAGLCYKFSKAVFSYLEKDFILEDELLVYAAIATVCDIVDLVQENRIIVKKGLSLINEDADVSIGLKALRTCRQLMEKQIRTYHIGFIIGPCINATGRLESASLAVNLFLSENFDEALVMAKRLTEINDERKEMTARAVLEVEEQIQGLKDDKVLVVYNETIHESIAGIVAGRIKESCYKPVIVITKSGQAAKGSGRSIEAYNMFEALYECRELFERFGGHYMAAGLSLKKENIDLLRQTLNQNCTLKDGDFEKIIKIDKELELLKVSKALARELTLMEPFGKENREALFLTKHVFTDRVDFIGSNKTIMQFSFADENNRRLKGICFDGYEKFKSVLSNIYPAIECNKILNNLQKKIELYLDIIYKLEINVYNNVEYLQLNIVDFEIC